MVPLIIAATDAEIAAGGMAGISIVVLLIALAIAVVWIIFPFLVIEKFNRQARLQTETNLLLRYIAERSSVDTTSQKVTGPSTTLGMTKKEGTPPVSAEIRSTKPEARRNAGEGAVGLSKEPDVYRID